MMMIAREKEDKELQIKKLTDIFQTRYEAKRTFWRLSL